MDINELEKFSLSDAVSFHDQLNPKLWGEDDQMKPEIREQLLTIANDFIEELGIPDLDVEDITLSGSNAAFTYTPHSDIDLHVLVDFNKLPQSEVYAELFNAKKNLYNEKHDITIKKIPVELYVQDSNQEHTSAGIYSVMNDEWLTIPKKVKANINRSDVRAKYEKLGELIELALKSNDRDKILNVIDIVKRYRKAGLSKGGEFSPENLAFKAVRKHGLFQDLWDLKSDLKSDELSIEERMLRERQKQMANEFAMEMAFKNRLDEYKKRRDRFDFLDLYGFFNSASHSEKEKLHSLLDMYDVAPNEEKADYIRKAINNIVKDKIGKDMRYKEMMAEKWSEKYKKSINCKDPKGFSQRAHCDSRKLKKESRKGLRELVHEELVNEIDFNDPKLTKDILNAPISCGFEAETVWTEISGESDYGPDSDYWNDVMDWIRDNYGERYVDQMNEAYSMWLMDYVIPDIHSELIDDYFREREEDEDVLNRYVEERVDDDDVEEYKDEYITKIKKRIKQPDLFDYTKRQVNLAKDELEELEDWDDEAWARMYVDENEKEEFEDWLREELYEDDDIRDEAMEVAYNNRDMNDWIRDEYRGLWSEAFSDTTGDYMPEPGDSYDNYGDEEAGLDEVEQSLHAWAEVDSYTDRIRTGGYHASAGDTSQNYWRIESDSSIEGSGAKAEIISPVYDTIGDMMKEMKSLFEYMEENDVETNKSTGLHITMSWNGDEGVDTNELKMVSLMGDPYVLKQFDREFNNYTKSQQENIISYAKRLEEPGAKMKDFKALEKELERGIDWSKFNAINFKGTDVTNDKDNQLIEFRAAGGDYLDKLDTIQKTAERYGLTMLAGHDDEAFKKDYIKAVAKLVLQNTGEYEPDYTYGQEVVPMDLQLAVRKVIPKDGYSAIIDQLSRVYDAKDDDGKKERAAKLAIQQLVFAVLNNKMPGKLGAKDIKELRDFVKFADIDLQQSVYDIQDYIMVNKPRLDKPDEKFENVPKAMTKLFAKKGFQSKDYSNLETVKYDEFNDFVIMPFSVIRTILDGGKVEDLQDEYRIVPRMKWQEAISAMGSYLHQKENMKKIEAGETDGETPEETKQRKDRIQREMDMNKRIIADFRARFDLEPGFPYDGKYYERNGVPGFEALKDTGWVNVLALGHEKVKNAFANAGIMFQKTGSVQESKARVEDYISEYESLLESSLDENLRAWFGKGKKGGAGGGGWDRYNTKGERIGKCGDSKPGEGKPKCLSKSRAASLRAKGGKAAIAAAVRKKRREDPNKNRRGKAKMVSNTTKEATDLKSIPEGKGIPMTQCPHCRGPIVHIDEAKGKKDACYHKVKSRYKVWPSAYASGALVKCRKVGAKNWGNKSKKK